MEAVSEAGITLAPAAVRSAVWLRWEPEDVGTITLVLQGEPPLEPATEIRYEVQVRRVLAHPGILELAFVGMPATLRERLRAAEAEPVAALEILPLTFARLDLPEDLPTLQPDGRRLMLLGSASVHEYTRQRRAAFRGERLPAPRALAMPLGLDRGQSVDLGESAVRYVVLHGFLLAALLATLIAAAVLL